MRPAEAIVSEPEPMKIFIQEDGYAPILCKSCGVVRKVEAAAFRGRGPKLRIRCGCGHLFGITVEFRRFYRQPTSLPGHYRINKPTEAGSSVKPPRGQDGCRLPDNCRIVNLSRSGIRLEMLWPKPGIQVSTRLGLRFELGAARQEEILLDVVVRNRDGNTVGCEFLKLDGFQEKALGFFLMR